MSLPTVGKFAENIYPALSSDIVGASPLVDGSNFDSEWWGDVNTADGTRLRVSFGGVEVASDPFHFDDTAEELLFRFDGGTILAASSDAARTIIAFPPNTRNVAYGVSDTYGQYNTYDSNRKGYWSDCGTDRTSFQNNGTPTGGVSLGDTIGKVGVATTFPGGSSDYVTMGILSDLDFSTSFSLSAWINRATTQLNPDSAVLSKIEEPGGNFDGYMGYYNSDTIDGYVNNGIRANSTFSFSANTWTHWAMDWDGSNIRIYINGSLSVSGSYSTAPTSASYNFRIGTYSATISRSFTGIENEVVAQDVSLSADEYAEEYDQTNDNATFWGAWTTGTLGPTIHELVGSTNSVTLLSGDLSVSGVIELVGSTDSITLLSGALSVKRNLSGSTNSITLSSGALNIKMLLSGSTDSITLLSGLLHNINNLEGSTDSVTLLSGLLNKINRLSGSSDSITLLSGDLSVNIALAGSTDSIILLSGDLTIVGEEGYSEIFLQVSEVTLELQQISEIILEEQQDSEVTIIFQQTSRIGEE